MIIWLLAGVLFAWASVADAAPCTKGTDCYCDKVALGGSLADAALLACEDFDAPSLVSSTGVGNGAPYFGPWFDESGFAPPCARGFNSYWARLYGPPVTGNWVSGQPSSPTFGCTCTYANCAGSKAWDATDRWNANGLLPPIAIYNAASNFSAEVGSITPPTNVAGSGGAAGIFDGQQVFVERVPAGLGENAGPTGGRNFGNQRNIGMTMALAYPSNSTASLVWSQPWKGMQWSQAVDGASGGDSLFWSHNEFGRSERSPWSKMALFFNTEGAGSEAQCNSAANAATVTRGEWFCTSGGFNYGAVAGVPYQRTRDWPDGTWGCIRGFIENAGLSNTRIRVWFTPTAGPNVGVEMSIVDIANLNTTTMSFYSNPSGYGNFTFDHYANTNTPGNGGPVTNQVTFRYIDNFHARAGAPVSCAQIGFGGASPTPPAAPTNLRISFIVLGLCVLVSVGVMWRRV